MNVSSMRPVAIITGAASGIGAHFGAALATAGTHIVILADNDVQRLQATHGDTAQRHLTPLDVSDPDAWRNLVADVLARFGRIDLLCNIAGVLKPGLATEAAIDEIDHHLDVNAKSVMYGTRIVGAHMAERGSGHIVNIASLGGISPVPGLALYAASKFAVRGYSLTSALELLPRGVAVTVICPDLVDTPMLDAQLQHDEAAITFSGSARPLTVEDTTALLFRALRERPLEICHPSHRGVTAKLVSAAPNLAVRLLGAFTRRGRAQQQALRRQRNKQK
jgi:3-oxoacyl-[acyl-carrier protein] reductase